MLVRICDDWQHACRCAGVALPGRGPSLADQLKLRDLTFQADRGELDDCGFCRAAAPLIGLNESQVRALSDAFIRGPFPGAAELVEELNTLGVATACLSNTNDNHWKLMSDRASPVHFPLHRLRHRFASHLIGARKPDDAIYAHVEQNTRVDPGAIVFFDDVFENIEAARKRGWLAHRIDVAPSDPIPQIRRVLAASGILAESSANQR